MYQAAPNKSKMFTRNTKQGRLRPLFLRIFTAHVIHISSSRHVIDQELAME